MLKIKDNVDLQIFIDKYDFKAEYDKDTGKIIELYRIQGFYLGERTRRRKSTTITKQQNEDNLYKYNGDFKNYWYINPFTRIFTNYKAYANCHLLCLDEDDYELLYDLIKADLLEKVEG